MEVDAYWMLVAIAAIVAGVAFAAFRRASGAIGDRRERSAAARRSATEYYARTLQQAAEVAGGEAELAATLNVSRESLRRWMEGAESPPVEVHLAALEVVTRGAPETKAE